MIPKKIDTAREILPAFSQRYSGVSFDAERSINQDQLLAISEAARWAPSCFGDQPWRFIICNKATDPKGWETAFSCLMEGNQGWCELAPVLIISCCDTRFSKNDKPNAYGPYDTGAAAISMCLQAASMGLMTHQMAGFNAEQASASFAIPERFMPMAMMALGYQLPEDKLPEALREREMAARSRNALAEHFFGSTWGKGLSE